MKPFCRQSMSEEEKGVKCSTPKLTHQVPPFHRSLHLQQTERAGPRRCQSDSNPSFHHKEAVSIPFLTQIEQTGAFDLTYQTCHDNVSRQRTNKSGEKIVVTDLSSASIVNGDQCFVEAVFLIAVVIAEFSSMTWNRKGNKSCELFDTNVVEALLLPTYQSSGKRQHLRADYLERVGGRLPRYFRGSAQNGFHCPSKW